MHSIKFTTTTLYCALACSFSTISVAGEYYKWTDNKGMSHFSERPPQSAQAVKVTTYAKAAPRNDAHNNEQAMQAPAAQPNSTLQNKQPDIKRCKTESKRLKTLGSGARIRMQDVNGGFYYLEQDQIQNEIKKSKLAIQESC